MFMVADIMQKDVVTFRPETTLGEAIAVLCDRHMSGAPVVSADNRIVGVISELALMDVLFDMELKSKELAPYMSTEVHTINEQSSLTQAVHMFYLYQVRRLPVVRDDKLVGIVSRRDLLTMCEKLEEPLAAPLQELMPEFVPESDDLPEERVGTELADLA